MVAQIETTNALTAGGLTAEHRRQIQAQMTVWAWGALATMALIGISVSFLLLKIANPALALRGEWIPVALIVGVWLWWLRHSIPQWGRARQDLAASTLAMTEGTIRYEMRNGIGLIPIMNYGMWVGSHYFGMTQAQLFALQSGRRYRVYHAPHSHVFLEAVLVPAEAPASKVEAPLAPASPPDYVESINERERELLRLIAQGYANKEIAQQLSLSVNTVKMYTSQLYQKMGVNRRTEAVARAREWGWLP